MRFRLGGNIKELLYTCFTNQNDSVLLEHVAKIMAYITISVLMLGVVHKFPNKRKSAIYEDLTDLGG